MPPASATSTAPSAISPGGGGDGGERARAHPVDGEARHGVGDPGEQRDVAAERQTLVADLRGRREDDVADPLGRDLRVAAQQLAHGLDAHVVGARAPVLALGAGLAERRPDAVDEEDFAGFAHRESTRMTRARVDWAERADAAIERYAGGETRDLDQRQLTQLGNAAWAAGLSLLMAGRADEAAEWLRRAARALPRELGRARRPTRGAGRSRR